MKAIGILAVVALLAGCGGGTRDRGDGPQVMRMSTGPISRACLSSDRKARSRQLCGCIQTVADRELTSADQRLAVRFYDDPHHAQEIRQSDRRTHAAFWRRYNAYATRAEASCRGY